MDRHEKDVSICNKHPTINGQNQEKMIPPPSLSLKIRFISDPLSFGLKIIKQENNLLLPLPWF